MFQIRDELCIGCGLCAQSCPWGAITLSYSPGWTHAKARIDPKRCTACQTCTSVCPQGAIETVLAGELAELRARIEDLKKRKDWLLERLDHLTPMLTK